jgi:OPA family glycerol-3-phosphate transporter-like MFS transporter
MGERTMDSRLSLWRRLTLWTLLVGYSGYYLCRSNLSVAAPLLNKDLDAGITPERLGDVMSVAVVLYAVGKLVNGVAADWAGGRRIFLFGMAASVACTTVLGFAGGLAVFAVLVSLNRFVQSMGWPALVKTASRWFPPAGRGSALGVLSTSYLLGDAAARLILGAFVKGGLGWRAVFFVSAALLGLIALGAACTLKSGPGDVGFPEGEKAAAAVQPEGEKGELWGLIGALLLRGSFWLVCLANFGLTLIRESFNNWTPTFLEQDVGLNDGEAGMASMAFPLAGAAAAVAGGWLSDRCGARHGRIMLPSVILMAGVLGLLAVVPLRDRPAAALVLLAAAGAFLIVPYSFCSGVLSIDLGGRRASATVSGMVDMAGYLGAILSGSAIVRVAARHGWPAAFGVLAAVAVLTAGAVLAFALRPPPAREPSP